MDLDFVSVHKHAKKELGQYPAILTSHLVNKPYIFAMFSVRARTRAYSSTFQDLDFDVSLSPLFIN